MAKINKTKIKKVKEENVKRKNLSTESVGKQVIDKQNVKKDNKEVLVSLRGVRKVYKVGNIVTKALNGIDLDIIKGEMLVVLGKSGCGKSTLLNVIGGMDNLDAGTFMFEGNDYSKLKEKERTEYRRNSIGFIFQSYNLMPELNALENVEFIAGICNHASEPEKMIEKVGLTEFQKKYPSQLSGGQAQRVSIARALVKNPKLILADEPTAALDYNTSIDVLSTIQQIVKNGATLIMVTHNEEISKMANRVIKMKDGKVVDIIINDKPCDANDLEW